MKHFEFVRGKRLVGVISAAAIRVEPTGELSVLESDDNESAVIATITLPEGIKLRSRGGIEVT